MQVMLLYKQQVQIVTPGSHYFSENVNII